MSSLPQGWHGLTGPSKYTSSTATHSGSSVPFTIRKKWNSPQASNVPQTKLPSYKSSTLRQQNYNLNSTYEVKPSVAAAPATQTKLPLPTKPSPVKEYKIEIEKLKKELSTIKAENSILKAKVRRVGDENDQKGRQIEKMRAEIKALQKNESESRKKNKDSQELILLRQKCLRLENALKDKDLTIKQLTSECKIKKQDSDNSRIPLSRLYQATPMQSKNTNKNGESESASAKSSLSRANLSLKNEVTKLRDMIHKLEKENQELQQQVKLHCQEIRRLKVQLRSKEKVTLPQTPASKPSKIESTKNITSLSALTSANAQEKFQTKQNISNTSVPKPNLVKNAKPSLPNAPKTITPPVKQFVPQKSNLQKKVLKTGKTASLPNENAKQISSNKLIKNTQPNRNLTKPGVTKSVLKQGLQNSVLSKKKNSELEHKVQAMRENNAAKKIQRSWRQHQKCLQHSAESDFQNGGKELTFIISGNDDRKSNDAKLNHLVNEDSDILQPMNKEIFSEGIKSISKDILDQNRCS